MPWLVGSAGWKSQEISGYDTEKTLKTHFIKSLLVLVERQQPTSEFLTDTYIYFEALVFFLTLLGSL